MPRLSEFPPRAVVALAALAGLVLLAAVVIAADLIRPGPARSEALELTSKLGLTDLVLVTEARYLRHLALSDLHSAFQDHPVALEHFPSGALILPPPHLRRPRASGGRP